MPVKKRRNPFYVLLIPVGAAFVVTAFAYGIMAFRAVNGAAAPVEETSDSEDLNPSLPHPLIEWMRKHGDEAMLWELGALAVLTVAAIATDRFWEGPPEREGQ